MKAATDAGERLSALLNHQLADKALFTKAGGGLDLPLGCSWPVAGQKCSRTGWKGAPGAAGLKGGRCRSDPREVSSEQASGAERGIGLCPLGWGEGPRCWKAGRVVKQRAQAATPVRVTRGTGEMESQRGGERGVWPAPQRGPRSHTEDFGLCPQGRGGVGANEGEASVFQPLF